MNCQHGYTEECPVGCHSPKRRRVLDSSRNEWEILDDLGKRLTVITEVTETMKESVQKSYLQLHSLTAKQLINELKSAMIRNSRP